LDKTLIGLVGGATLALVGGAASASASPASGQDRPLKPARSFAELLEPVPNASATLKAMDVVRPANAEPRMQLAQYYYHHHHHHHHHHYYYHHHHHHWGWRWGWRGHHHHHHHHHYW